MTQPPYNPLEPTVPSTPEPQMPPPTPPAPSETPGYQPATPDVTPQVPQEPPAPQTPQVPDTPQVPETPQAPQAPYPPQQAPYPPGQAYPAGQPQQFQYAAPAAPMYVAQPPAPKKRRTGMIVAIVIVAVALVAAGGYFGFRAVIGNRLTPYCRAANDVTTQIQELSDELTTASTQGDLDQMSEIMGEMLDVFDQLRNASPPDTVAPSLDTVYDYLTHVKDFIDSQDMVGYMTYMSQHDPMEFATAATTVDTASVEYCNG